jgi:hypothetical protein
MYELSFRRGLQLLACLVLFPSIGFAQTQDRTKLEKDIEMLRDQLKQKETEFLGPAPEDRAQFAEFLLQPGAGLARLLPREKYRETLSVREGGAYYSFTKLSNSYDRDPQIGLEQEYLSTGFAGADFGFLASLGDVPLESVVVDHPGVQYIASFTAPTSEPEARDQQRRSSTGFVIGPNRYKNRLPVTVGGSYVLRCVNYERSDLLVAFRVVRQDTDGSLILLWKKLREFPTPFLTRP